MFTTSMKRCRHVTPITPETFKTVIDVPIARHALAKKGALCLNELTAFIIGNFRVVLPLNSSERSGDEIE